MRTPWTLSDPSPVRGGPGSPDGVCEEVVNGRIPGHNTGRAPTGLSSRPFRSPKGLAMYGLTQRLVTPLLARHDPDRGAGDRARASTATRSRSTCVRAARSPTTTGSSSPPTADEALALIDEHRPDVVMLDMSLGQRRDRHGDRRRSPPATSSTRRRSIMIDPEQPVNAMGLRQRIDDAIRVARRVYLGGGLRNRAGRVAENRGLSPRERGQSPITLYAAPHRQAAHHPRPCDRVAGGVLADLVRPARDRAPDPRPPGHRAGRVRGRVRRGQPGIGASR